jgi:hypothetical protein
MRFNSQRGLIDPLTLGLVLGLAGGVFFGKWAPFSFLKPKPDTAALTAAQAQLATAKTDAAAKEAALLAAHQAEQARLMEQLQAAQQFTVGAENALVRVPAAQATPEVKVGAALLLRGNLRLATAIGKLPPGLQDEIVTIVDQMLSADAGELAKAQAALASKDADFKTLTAERDAIKAQIPKLQQQADAAKEQVAVKEQAVTSLTNQVKDWAAKKFASDQQAGSLLGALASLRNLCLWVAGVWAFLAFVLPGIIKHMDSGVLKNTLRAVSGYATSPLLFHDASKKISSLSATSTPPSK